jgi:hypothetical protein
LNLEGAKVETRSKSVVLGEDLLLFIQDLNERLPSSARGET